MKIGLVSLALILLLQVPAIATRTDVTGTVDLVETHSSTATDQDACEAGNFYVKIGNTWYWHPASGEDGRALMATLLSAHASGSQVKLYSTDALPNCAAQYRRIVLVSLIR